jgi:hypothetical protein
MYIFREHNRQTANPPVLFEPREHGGKKIRGRPDDDWFFNLPLRIGRDKRNANIRNAAFRFKACRFSGRRAAPVRPGPRLDFGG